MIKKNYEFIIKNGYIVDGSGNPWYKADIGIKDGKIATIGCCINEKDGDHIINAKDLIVCPGFIDLHNHSDRNILARPFCKSNIMQGITTAVVGNCGSSMAPISQMYLSNLQEYFAPFLLDNFDYGWEWSSLGDYYRKVEKKSIAINLAPLVGHGTIRMAVKGFSQEPVTTEEMKKMKFLLRQSLQEGAFGMSTGLVYPPGCYSNTAELVELCDELRNFGRVYTSHIRNEGRELVESVQEAIEIGRKNNITVQISHHKAKGKSNWGKVTHTLRMMEQERTKGLEIGCDVYPYLAGATTITSLLPSWALEGGISKMLERLKNDEQRKRIKKDFIEDNIKDGNDIKDAGFEGIIIASSKNQKYEGMSIGEIIKKKKRLNEPFEAMFDLILELKGNATVHKFIMDEEDMRFVLTHPLSAIITDSSGTDTSSKGKPHPRAYGTFPRVLGKYVREKRIMRLEEAIRKMTSYPASIMRIRERGLLHQGYWADIVIFDPDKIIDCATYQNPHQYPLGIHYIIINGKIAVDQGNLAQEGYGKVLRAK
jgi:N-acyl-D-amino-acid deacylase